MMKVLIIHVGNEIDKPDTESGQNYLIRKSLLDGENKYYMKHDIINADTQMQSIIDSGVSVEYGHLSDRKSIGSLWRAGKRIRQICFSEKIDVVHVLWGTTTSLMTVLASPVPVIISFCGSDLLGNVDQHGKMTLSGRLSRMFSQISALMAKRLITKSELMKKSLWSVSQRKCVAIPNGLDLSAFYPIQTREAKIKLDWNPDKKTIIFFDGGGAKVKDQNLADNIAKLVMAEFDNVEYRILHGILHDELVYYYNAADVMILTSFHEGSNNSLKEAMACNLPIVSVNVGDSMERINSLQNSYVVQTREPKDLADKVKEVIISDTRSNGRQFVSALSSGSMARQVIEQYNLMALK